MGFWDFIAPDLEGFRRAVEPVLPPLVIIPGVGAVDRENLVLGSWSNPGSGLGLALRVYYELSKAGGNLSQGNATQNGIANHVASTPGQQITLRGTSIMGQLVINKVYRCTIEMAAGGHEIANVVHVEGTAAGQEAAAAAAVLAGWKVATGPLTQLSSLVAMTQVTAMDLSSTSGGISIISDTTAGGVSSTNSLATRGACALVKLNGGTRDRSSRGRVYYGPIMEQNIQSDGATLQSSALTAFSTAFSAFKTSLSGASFTLGVASRKNSTFTSAGTLSLETTIATQRRRIRS